MSKEYLEDKIVVPDWAKWLATDSSGDVFAYEDRPVQRQFSWDAAHGARIRLYRTLPPKDWKDELYHWG